MNNWQTLLVKGNEYYQQQQWLAASQCYRQAEQLLQPLWKKALTNVELMMAWVTVNHNLAAVYEQQNDMYVALQFLLAPHQRMLWLSQKAASKMKISTMAAIALGITHKQIVRFCQKHAIKEDDAVAFNTLTSIESCQRYIKSRMH